MKLFSSWFLVTQLKYHFAVSTFTKGEQMVPVLNDVGTMCAVFGNHDFGMVNFTSQFFLNFLCMQKGLFKCYVRGEWGQLKAYAAWRIFRPVPSTRG